MNKLDDLHFDYGWRKKMTINNQEIEVIFDAYEGEELTENQTESYQKFEKSQTDYLDKAEKALQHYQTQYPQAQGFVKYTALYFARNGEFGILADCNWDPEHGLAILLEPEVKITEQDTLI